jgi:hypothetical protein
MAINSNHISEDLDGIKCVIVEKNVSPERVAFLKPLLEYNYLTVVVVPSPPAKVAAPAAATATEEGAVPPPPVPPAPETFTVGVTNMLFNTTNAIYGRLLSTPDGHVVTAAYWQQRESVSHDEVPYYERK